MRFLGIILVVVVVVGGLAWPAGAQDSTRDRVSELETQVAELDDRVATLEATGPGSSSESAGEVFTVRGTVGLLLGLGMLGQQPGEECSGNDADDRGYEDIREGTDVVVEDGEGRTVGSGALEQGTVEWIETNVIGRWCQFPFEVEVPRADFYSIRVSHRDGPTYSLEDMEDADWEVELTLS